MLPYLSKIYGNLIGGSADLEGPNATARKNEQVYSATNRSGKVIRFGIREFGMAAITNGIQLHGGFRTFCATFLVFADYLRPALRLSALMKLPVKYVFTHDSIFVGEDGPTHQPIETLESLRVIPGVQVLRPGDAEETAVLWQTAMDVADHPVCMILSRQNIVVYEKEDPDWQNTINCGAYIVRKGASEPDITLLATGSEVGLALRAAESVTGKTVRVVSVPDRDRFASQPDVLKDAITGESARIITVEAGSRNGWEGFVRNSRDIFSIDRFGESGPGDKVATCLGYTAENLVKLIEA
jgi:transketolase